MEIVVAGGGVAGLTSALVLARAGHHVTLVERDPLARDDDWRAAFEWPRTGIPHFHQPHAFLPRGRKVIREMLPDVFDSLLVAGAFDHEVWRRAPAGQSGEPPAEDRDVTYLCARRELIEWALRNAALAESNIAIRSNTIVAGLLGDEGFVPRVKGVVTSSGEQMRSDLVVDATGRRSPLPSWLSLLGGQPPEVDTSECNLVYYSRYFRTHTGNRFPEGPWLAFPRGDLGYAGYGTFIGDNRTFSIIFNVPAWDRELRELRREGAFMAACHLTPFLETIADPEFADPITPVLAMGSMQNSLRNYAPGGRPVAEGIIPVGDSYCHTDPMLSLGLSMSLIHAGALSRAVDKHPDDLMDIACDYFAATFPEAAERYALVRDIDSERSRAWVGEKIDASKRTGSYPLFATNTAGAVARRDPDVFRKVTRRIDFLDRTSVFDDDVHLQERIERLFAEMVAEGPRPPVGPDRDTLLAEIRAALEPAPNS